ncbi:Pentapeptide repeat-containing protein [Saccharicrinis carchari]|uniref:Pentapeptide repeat-containing protein n=1 Tax=Saccharicrinis carchari TaxID=1168039 RepID=A0A521EDC9_SACCC|nr:pentapeptide repeat-containing protein [Saccharicrinis carchari]SMO81947.1 Pentapeptide repeat-containing protein [Saccharicrinis carchari]
MDNHAIEILKQGVKAWNKWRSSNPGIKPDLSRAILQSIVRDKKVPVKKGHKTDLRYINFADADLSGVSFENADLRYSDFRNASLLKANFRRVDLEEADLRGADLYEVDLYQANLRGAKLIKTRLTRSRLVDVCIEDAILQNCEVYGISAWNVSKNTNTLQSMLRVNDPAMTWEAPILIDNLEAAQYINLFLDPEKVRDVINATTAKLVLILGRFTENRKKVLDKLRDELRKHNLVAIIFDFEFPDGRSMIETVGLLARMSRFVIADLSDAKIVINELQEIIPVNPSLPVIPIIDSKQTEPAILRKHHENPGYLKPISYTDINDLISNLEMIVKKAEHKAVELRDRKLGLGISSLLI